MSDPLPPPCPPPMRVAIKGWLTNREMSHAEAERWHLKQAMRLVGNLRQAFHLEEAHRNRVWGAR